MTDVPLLVGRDLAPRGTSGPPLCGGSGGRRLAMLCGIDGGPYDLARYFQAVTLYPHHLPYGRVPDWAEARCKALLIERDMFTPGRKIVLIGYDVRRAFKMHSSILDAPLLTFQMAWRGMEIAFCPDLTNRNRYWKDPANVDTAKAFFHELMGKT